MKFDKNKCLDCALQCSTRGEFSKRFSGAYQNCIKYGWLDEVCSHMKHIKHRNGYWNYDTVINEARKYSTLKDFRVNAQGAYDYACDHKLIEEIKTFLTLERKPNKYWEYERCLEESKKYRTLIDFHDKSPSAYRSAQKNDWLKEFVWLESTRNENYGKTYTIDELNALSKQCINRTEFKKKYYHAYKYSKINNFLNELEFMPISGTEVYERHLPDGTISKVLKPQKGNKNRVAPKKWAYENCVNESKKYKYFDEFRVNSASAYTIAGQRGWLNDFTWLIRKRKAPNYWTEERCYEEAKKYTKMEDFVTNSFNAYNKSRKNGWHKKYTWLESNPIGKEEFLTYDVCYNEAKKYEFLSEFRKLSNSIYSKSGKMGWLKDFTWLKKTRSFLEAFFEKNLIKNNVKYEYQKTFPWLKMDGQQYLDFYLPDYNIGVECQGKQHFEPSNNPLFADYELTSKRDENKYKLCKKHNIKIVYYSLVKYETKHKVYNDIKELFCTELGLDFEYYDYNEVLSIESKTRAIAILSKEHKRQKRTPTKRYKVGCEIIQKTPDGKEIKRWKSIDDICDFYECSHSCILSAIKGVNSTGKGFIWECDLSTGKYVYEIDENGNILHKFDTPEEAGRFYNICNNCVRQRCDNKNLKPYKGHIFTYCPNEFDKEEFLKIDKTEQKQNGYWTYERCYEEAKKYKTFTEFYKNCSGASSKAFKKGWLKEWKLFEKREEITFERCSEIASNYQRIIDFKKENRHLYDAMVKNGWVRKIFKYEGKKVKNIKD